MDLNGRIVAVTGAAQGIGEALARRFAAAGARVAVLDLKEEKARAVAEAIGGVAMAADVGREADIARAIERIETEMGPIALFVSNAGIGGEDPDLGNSASASDDTWDRNWRINVMAHVWAARALIPHYKARGGGAFVNVVSAAGLLSQIGSATYSTTKHAAIGFAENLAYTHKDDGIRVSVLCPQGVATAMIEQEARLTNPAVLDGVLTTQQVAECVMDALAKGTFLILPHPQVLDYIRAKTTDYDRWLGGMAKLRRGLIKG